MHQLSTVVHLKYIVHIIIKHDLSYVGSYVKVISFSYIECYVLHDWLELPTQCSNGMHLLISSRELNNLYIHYFQWYMHMVKLWMWTLDLCMHVIIHTVIVCPPCALHRLVYMWHMHALMHTSFHSIIINYFFTSSILKSSLMRFLNL